MRVARCHCEALTLECEGDPRKVSLCHCVQCQRRSGSSFSIAVFFPREQVQVTGGRSSVFRRPSASGFAVSFHFCAQCGANVFWEPERMPGLVGVAYGAFAGQMLPPPEQAVWAREAALWPELPQDLPVFDENPPPRPR